VIRKYSHYHRKEVKLGWFNVKGG